MGCGSGKNKNVSDPNDQSKASDSLNAGNQNESSPEQLPIKILHKEFGMKHLLKTGIKQGNSQPQNSDILVIEGLSENMKCVILVDADGPNAQLGLKVAIEQIPIYFRENIADITKIQEAKDTKQFVVNMINELDRKHFQNQSPDLNYSGVSICGAFFKDNDCHIFHLGNSGGMLGRMIIEEIEENGIKEEKEEEKKGESSKHNESSTDKAAKKEITALKELVSVELTERHTTENENEVTRISNAGGLIKDKKGFVDGNNMNEIFPVSRGIGYINGKQIGINSTPDFNYFLIQDDCKFILLANIGFWNIINFNEIIGYIKKNDEKTVDELTKELMELASERWEFLIEAKEKALLKLMKSEGLSTWLRTKLLDQFAETFNYIPPIHIILLKNNN